MRLRQREIIGIFPHREFLSETAYLRQVQLDLDHLLGKGFGWAFIINILLTLLGYIPGLIHAFWVQTRD